MDLNFMPLTTTVVQEYSCGPQVLAINGEVVGFRVPDGRSATEATREVAAVLGELLLERLIAKNESYHTGGNWYRTAEEAENLPE